MMHEFLYRSIEKKNVLNINTSIGVTIKCTYFGDVGLVAKWLHALRVFFFAYQLK